MARYQPFVCPLVTNDGNISCDRGPPPFLLLPSQVRTSLLEASGFSCHSDKEVGSKVPADAHGSAYDDLPEMTKRVILVITLLYNVTYISLVYPACGYLLGAC